MSQETEHPASHPPAAHTLGRAPRFSVIVPAYNVEAYLEDTVASVRAQTCDDWELVIVDDGSTDATGRIASRLAESDGRIRVLAQQNGGCASASNTAWRAARGEYVCILGADDLYLPEYLEAQSRFIDRNPGCDIYSCNGLKLYPDGRTEPYFSDARHRRETSFTLDDWLESNPIFGLAIFRRDLAGRIGGYRVGLRNAEDYDFWLRAMASGARHRHNPATLACYRRHGGNKSGDLVAAAEAVLGILEDLKATPELEPSVRAHLDRVLVRRRAAVARRRLEARMLAGDFSGARREFWRVRRGYASRAKYAAALAIVMLSPQAYARFGLASPG
jgi:glycosyltransferase involved in cell wall biosynthesis